MLTDLKRTFRAHDEKLLYHQALLASLEDVVISTDEDFMIKTWNAAAERIYEINEKDAIGKKFMDVVKHEYVNITADKAIKQLVKENSWKGVVKITNSTGAAIFLQSSITTVRNQRNKKIGYVGISRDITHELMTKQSLQEVQSVLNILQESFLIADRNLKIVFLSPKEHVQDFFSSDYHVGDHALKYIPLAYRDEVSESYQRALNGETVSYDAESDTDPPLYFNVTYTPVRDSEGFVTNVCVIIKDFTEQKKLELLQEKKREVEKSLFESRRLFEVFMENSPLLAWIVDEKGIVHYMNPLYLKSFSFTKDVTGKNIFDLFPREVATEYFENNKKVIQSGIAIETIEKGRGPGAMHSYKIIKFPIFFNDVVMVAGWAVNISDQISMQETLAKLNQHKDKLVSVIAHDLRGPLGINHAFLNTIIDDYETYSREEILNCLLSLKKSASRCFNLIDDLLIWARTQLDKINFNPKSLTIQDEISKVTDYLTEQIREKNISIETEFNYLGDVYADADMLAIVIRNLVSNAIKFSYSGKTINISTSLYGDIVIISVKDEGVGMKKELAEKIMHKANHESSFGTRGEKGAGLGLLLAKDYIEKNGGEMNIETEEDKGCTFHFTVPCHKINVNHGIPVALSGYTHA